ncbi:hypothetical protein M422DRAFT_271912 [Sphaerobolus stellatus SS14]|uniref:Uncharacterized protein n=1 Tax=Sphaerobolus stellatus (strain SS14) TaxID=990650 RepID=A0A0C9UNV4_SPHS4|nr:hypothetical protein M422DRAFT_271912 [Sphaerobolus stellatus SS14]
MDPECVDWKTELAARGSGDDCGDGNGGDGEIKALQGLIASRGTIHGQRASSALSSSGRGRSIEEVDMASGEGRGTKRKASPETTMELERTALARTARGRGRAKTSTAAHDLLFI